MIQTELEEAGFDPISLKNLFFSSSNPCIEDDISGDGGRNDVLEEELERWAQNYIDVNRYLFFLIENYVPKISIVSLMYLNYT